MNSLFGNKKIAILLFLIFFGLFAYHNLSVLASEVLNEDFLNVDWPAPPVPGGQPLTAESTLPDLVRYFYEWGIFLGGLAAFIALIIAGFYYLTSFGNPGAMKEARNRIISAIFGLVLLLGSWVILHTINPQLLVLEMPEREIEPLEPPRPLLPIGEEEAARKCDRVSLRAFPEGAGGGAGRGHEPPPLRPNVCVDIIVSSGILTEARGFVLVGGRYVPCEVEEYKKCIEGIFESIERECDPKPASQKRKDCLAKHQKRKVEECCIQCVGEVHFYVFGGCYTEYRSHLVPFSNVPVTATIRSVRFVRL